MNIEKLKKLAEAATAGPWTSHKDGGISARGVLLAGCGVVGGYIANSRYIAAANPAAILALIAERNELLAALKDVGFILDMIRTNKDGQAQLYVKSCAGNIIKVQDVVEAARSVVAKAEG